MDGTPFLSTTNNRYGPAGAIVEFGGAAIPIVVPFTAKFSPISRCDMSNACVAAPSRISTAAAMLPFVVALNVWPYVIVAGVAVSDGRVARLPSAL